MSSMLGKMVVYLVAWMTTALFTSAAFAVPNPKERIDYWQKNFTELTAEEDVRVRKAHRIFKQILGAAGKRPGINPRLHIIKENPFNVVLPVSIPDGWVVLSEQVLSLCYQDVRLGDDRLAFIIAHEIAHLLDDDFWHMNFFNALESLQSTASISKDTITEIKGIFGETSRIQAKELRADERGILFATMAGFNPNAIVQIKSGSGKKQTKDSFFHQWQDLLDVGRLSAALDKTTHPPSSQRSAAVLARLNQVRDQADLFTLGLIYYRTGNFALAVDAFNEFLRYFPSREVYHNLAVSHHQLAIQYFSPQKNDRLLPFKLPITADPYTRAVSTTYRSAQSRKGDLFLQHIDKAIEHYQAAISQDPGYSLAYLNLASAFLLQNQPYKAIALLQDVPVSKDNKAQINNILGVGLYMAKNVDEAREKLTQAVSLQPEFSAPYYNLGKIAYLSGNKRAAKRYWISFAKLEPESQWPNYLATNLKIEIDGVEPPDRRDLSALEEFETIYGIQIGNFLSELPSIWGKPVSIKNLNVSGSIHSLLEYDNGVTLVADGEEIRVIVTHPGFKGKSQQGISIGSDRKLLMSSYGLPGITLGSSQGDNFLYPQNGVTFQLQRDKVVSWIIY